MLNRKLSEGDVFRAALGPGEDCPPIEVLEGLASGATSQAAVPGHVKDCAYCQTELHLLRQFHSVEAGQTNGGRKTAALLQKRSKEILHQAGVTQARVPWWKAAFTVPRMAQASLALALVLVVAGAVVRFRTTTLPSPHATTGTSQEVLRSGGFAVISPSGDVHEAPQEVRWEKVSNATHYQVRLVEVDGNELWKAESTEDHIDLPASVRSRIVPAKTLFCEISAFDSTNAKVGDSGLVRFRLQKG